MPRNPKRTGGGRAKQRRSRPKLDPRLALLLTLPERRRYALKAEEDARLAALGKELAAGKHGELFAPLTTGLFVPPGNERGKAWPIRLDEPFVSAFVLSDAGARDLEALGARVRSEAGDVFTTFIPLSAIARLEKSSAVRYIELARPLLPALDKAVPYAQLDTLHAGSPANDGTGVIVGVIDDLLDVYHPDFRTAANASRVLFLWEQNLSRQGGESAPSAGTATYGVEYNQATINAELNHPASVPAYQTMRHGGKVNAHGTHVTGIAAGNGRAQGGTFAGAAPGAGIIFVASAAAHDETPITENTFVLDGIAYIFAQAVALNQPCVVNMSNSDNQGAHDGTSLGERFLDNLLVTPGRAIVLSAGNSNNTASHAAGIVMAGNSVDLALTYGAGTNVSDAVDIWYDGHDRFDVTVILSTGASIGPLAPGSSATGSLPGNIDVHVTSVLNDPRNGDNAISIIFAVPDAQSIPAGTTTIRMTGTTVVNGAFHAWVDRNNRGRSAFTSCLKEDELTLGVPATARRAITVGNHSRAAPIPAINTTSGRGPSRDGRVKPEIASVGMGMNASQGVTAPKSEDRTTAPAGGRYVAMIGTSMSAPLVAGACACLFQCRGASTTWADLKQILADTAGAAAPVNAFGYGFMQIGAGCSVPAPSVDIWLRDHAADAGAEPFTGGIAWLSPDIEVLDRNGNAVANPGYDPVRRFNNIIQVTVRNRGSSVARNTEVHFYWADPATNIPYPEAWNITGIYSDSPGFVNQSNTIVIPQIAPGGSHQVRFGWAPPAPGANIRGDDHFCLLVRLENEGDPSLIGAGGWSAVTASNNVALHNIHVQPDDVGDASLSFYFVGTADDDGMTIYRWLKGGQLRVLLPVQALPWRDIRLIERLAGPRPEFGRGGVDALNAVDATLRGGQVRAVTGIVGADVLKLHDGIATVTMGDAQVLQVPHVRIANGARMATRIHVTRPKVDQERRFVHVAQHAGGQLMGGVSLELRPRRR